MKKPLVILVLLALVGLVAGTLAQPVTIAQEPIPTPTPKPCDKSVRGKLCFTCLPAEVAVIKLRWLSIDDPPNWTDWTPGSGDATPLYGRYDGGVCIDASMDWLSYNRLEWRALDSEGNVILSGQMPLPKGWKGPECEPKIQWDLVVNLSPYGPVPAPTYAPMPTPAWIAPEAFVPTPTWVVPEAAIIRPQSYAPLMAEASGSLRFGPTYGNGFSIFGSGNLVGGINDTYQSACTMVMQNLYLGQVMEGTLNVGSAGNQFTVYYTGFFEFVSESSPYGPATARFTHSGQITAASGVYAYLLGASFDFNGYGLIGYPIPVNGSVRSFFPY